MHPPSPLDQANALLRHLGDQIGIPSLRLDERGCCLLRVARRWTLSLVLEPAHETLYLSCPITAPGQLEAIPLAAWVSWLQAQHLGGGSPGAAVTVDPQGRVCVQQALYLPATLPARLVEAVEILLARAARCATWLTPADAASAAASPAPTATTTPAAFPALLHHTRI